jgi:hypothetical protein
MIQANLKFSGLRRVEQGELPRVQSPLAYASGSCIVEYSESHDAPFFPERKIHQILPVFQGC